MIINKELTREIYNIALNRGLYKGVNFKDIILNQLNHIRKETKEAEKSLDEFLESKSISTGYNPDKFETEIIDIMIICLSLCEALNIDIESEMRAKIIYNASRND